MKLQSLMLRNSLFVLALLLALPAFRAAAQSKPDSAPAAQSAAIPARITQAIDETQLVRLHGNVHPLARPEFDQGAVTSELPMQRMLLVLKRSMEQESTLAQFMVDQQNTASPNYHKWLTPEQFGAQFGPADADIQTVNSWLQSHGFQVAKVSKGKIAIEFSGTAAQVSKAFHTDIHKFVMNGETHYANSSDPQIPAALTPVVHGLAPLNNFRAKPEHHVAGEFTRAIGSTEVKSVKPEFTTSRGNFAIGPTDFATIYNVLPLWNATPTAIDGSGQSIAVIGVSNINQQDITDFRTLFGLPTGGPANAPIVVIDGADPGIINDGSETEALLDVEWSGAIAKGAQIHFVIAADTDIASGFILAIFHVIDNNSDPILSLSFGNCEPNLGVNGNNLFLGLWEQSAAQGITVTVASGDPGSAGCENQNAPAPNPATTGLQVSGFASTPFNVAVGGTDFNDAGTQSTYFKPFAQDDPNTQASAISYIPESTWNESCTNAFFGSNPEANCNSTLAANKAAVLTIAGSGGPSHCFTLTGTTCSGGYTKPAYQSFISAANGMPAANSRNIPDVSLFASSGFNLSFYAVCEADFGNINPALSCKKGQAFQFVGVGGTSASTPSFAGIMALVNQKNWRQGNANFALYKMAQTQFAAATACNSVASPPPNANCTFNDVTTGTIAMPCAKSSRDCNPTVGTDTIGVLSGYGTTAGYDLATGLGSVNANNLVNNWSTALTAFTSTTTTLSLTLPAGMTAGQNATVNVTVTPGSGTAKPTGDVALVSTAATGEGVDGFTLDANSKVVNGTTNQLTGGTTYAVTARYAGDGTFAPSVSAPVMVTVGKAASSAVGSVFISIGNGNFAAFTSGQAPQTLFLQATINPGGVLLPTGTVNFVDTFNGTPTTVASNVGVNVASEAFTVPGISTFGVGNHSIVANYSGDSSFNASSSPPVAFTITAANNPVPTITAPLVPASATAGGAAFPLTVNGTNFVSNSTVNFGGAAKATTFVNSTQLTASILASDIANAGTPAVTVTNPTPGGGTSNSVNFTVNAASVGTFTVTGPATAVPVTAGSSAGATITVTPSGTFSNPFPVVFTCPSGGAPAGTTCSPLTITIPAGSSTTPVTGTLTVNVAAPSTTLTASAAPAEHTLYAAGAIPPSASKGWWSLSAGSGLAALFLFFLPGRKRYRAALGLGLVCVLSFTLGCGGYGGGGGGGPAATTTKITVTSTKVPSGTNIGFSIAVNSSAAANGQVQLFDGTATQGTPVTVSNGSATIMASLLPGTHSISAHYLGDSYTQASQSGALNVTVTGGPVSLAITTAPAATPAASPINVTIQ
jgi:pro-kumamolisin-like protein/Big-like domain-containing protein